MILLHFILSFLAGALVCNALPHLTAGVRGEPFPSPFSQPRGIGLSSPQTNVFWGSANLFLGLLLFYHPVWLGFAIGFVAMAWFAAKHFGAARAAGFQKL